MTSSNDGQNEALRVALALTESELYWKIGELQSLSAAPQPQETLIRRGQDWISAQTSRFRSALCGNEDIRRLTTGDEFALASAILVALAAQYGSSTQLATVAALLAKVGIKSLCEDSWSID